MNDDVNYTIKQETTSQETVHLPSPKPLNSFAIINGVYLGLILIVFSLIAYVADLPRTSWVNYIAYILVLGWLIYSAITYRDKELGGFISYGKSLGLGTLTGLYSSIIMAVYTYFFFQYFDPAELQTILTESENALIDQGMSDQDIETAMKFTRMISNPPVLAAFTVLGFTFWSFIFSLIISIFIKKENPDQIFNE